MFCWPISTRQTPSCHRQTTWNTIKAIDPFDLLLTQRYIIQLTMIQTSSHQLNLLIVSKASNHINAKQSYNYITQINISRLLHYLSNKTHIIQYRFHILHNSNCIKQELYQWLQMIDQMVFTEKTPHYSFPSLCHSTWNSSSTLIWWTWCEFTNTTIVTLE